MNAYSKIFGSQKPVFDGRSNLYVRDPLPIGKVESPKPSCLFLHSREENGLYMCTLYSLFIPRKNVEAKIDICSLAHVFRSLYTRNTVYIMSCFPGKDAVELEVTLDGEGKDRVFRVSIKWQAQVN